MSFSFQIISRHMPCHKKSKHLHFVHFFCARYPQPCHQIYFVSSVIRGRFVNSSNNLKTLLQSSANKYDLTFLLKMFVGRFLLVPSVNEPLKVLNANFKNQLALLGGKRKLRVHSKIVHTST